MVLGYLLVALIAAAVAVFALQNGAPTPVRFLAWNVPDLPLAGLILGALAAGLIVAGIPLGIQRARARGQARRLQERVRELEARVAQQDRVLLAQQDRPALGPPRRVPPAV